MADIQPFAAIRPAPAHAAAVSSPPYDVLDRDEVIARVAASPESFLRVIRPDAELPDGTPASDPRFTQVARDNLAALERDGAMQRDAAPCFYIYELSLGGHTQVGVVAGASCREYDQGLIKRHEHTREKELDGRTRHIEGVGAQTGPVMLTYRKQAAIDALVNERRAADPVYDFVADDAVRHRLWVVGDAEGIAALRERFARDVSALYIADGHHRSAASHAVWKRHQREGETTPYDHYLVVLIPDDQVQILAYNRLVNDLGDLDADALLAAAGERGFDVVEANQPQPGARGRIGIYCGGRWRHLVARDVDPSDDTIFDAQLLQERLLAPLLGIVDVKTDPRIDFIGGIRGAAELERRADATSGVAFFMHPVSVAQLIAVSDDGGVLPPKSTWFEPKLRSGLFVRPLTSR
ncbi:MAG: DUF1015 domain-containing protein [Myxococcales bacterium]|nr:DUF1015 domain-containing protein [Myxococcales bacterium]